MLVLKTWPTPNGQKVQILLEELGVPYCADPVNILRGDQFAPDFLEISPNNKIPALIDDQPETAGGKVTIFESGAIMLYLSERHGRFLGQTPAARLKTLEWLFFQCASLGPMLGQSTHFRRYAKTPAPYAIDRFTAEAQRLYGVVDRQLQRSQWLAGNDYTIADMASYPWLVRFRRQGVDLDEFSNVKRWIAAVAERPAVQRGMEILKDAARTQVLDNEAHSTLFKS